MDKNQILVFSAVLVVLGIRLYMKYKKKDKIQRDGETKSSASTSSFPSSSKDEDYEPYSKK